MRNLLTWGLISGLITCGGWACGELERDPAPPPIELDNVLPLFIGVGIGEACDEEIVCRSSLECASGLCEVTGDQALNEPCVLTAECSDELICGWAGFCVESGGRERSQACSHDSECIRGTLCERTGGIAGECVESDPEGLDVGVECSGSGTCAAGLVCSPDRDVPICLPGSLLLNPDVFRGVACAEAAESEMFFGMRHALPNAGADFFATPFPSDLRISAGRLDLRDYPTPGAVLNQRDLFDQLLRGIEALRSGWSRNPGVYLRFTRPLDPRYQLSKSDPGWRDLSEDIKLVDLETGDYWPAEVRFHLERNKYICAHSVFLHPSWAHPLTSGHRYAALVFKSLDSADGEGARPLDVTAELLRDAAPRDDLTREAWERYSPLRTWIKDHPAVGSRVVGATVFTVREDEEPFRRSREAVYEADQVRFDPNHSPVLCTPGVRSPCAYDDETRRRLEDLGMSNTTPRDCPDEESDLFHEIHARVRIPNFQHGTPPYEIEGGDVRFENGKPQLARFESVCMAITVPKTASPPEDGWPVVIYGHGTGGDFRSGVKLLARSLSALRLDPPEDAEPDTLGTLSPVVLIEIDQVMHGPRLGADQLRVPGPLFFNIQNPGAARGNLIQGALDNFALTRFITQSSDLHDWDFGAEVGQLSLNRERISYHGHSQGGTTGPLFAPFEEDLSGVVFSGTAGGLMFSLMDKKEPYDATLGLQLALQEFEIQEDHPALHIFQEYFDDVDPLNYADRLFKQPAERPLHLLHVYGRHDTFTPDRGQRSFAAASGATLAIPNDTPEDFDLMSDLRVLTEGYPLRANQTVGSVGSVTATVVQFAPETDEGRDLYNGHFVIYRHPTARAQLFSFLRDLSLGQTPSVVETAPIEPTEPTEPTE